MMGQVRKDNIRD